MWLITLVALYEYNKVACREKLRFVLSPLGHGFDFSGPLLSKYVSTLNCELVNRYIIIGISKDY